MWKKTGNFEKDRIYIFFNSGRYLIFENTKYIGFKIIK